MSFSINRLDSFPDFCVFGLAPGATTIKEAHVPFAEAVPPIASAVGKGMAFVYGKLYGYDGTSAGYVDMVFAVASGSPAVITDDHFTMDANVPMAVALVADTRGDLSFQITNNSATKTIDCAVTDIKVRYLQP